MKKYLPAILIGCVIFVVIAYLGYTKGFFVADILPPPPTPPTPPGPPFP